MRSGKHELHMHPQARAVALRRPGRQLALAQSNPVDIGPQILAAHSAVRLTLKGKYQRNAKPLLPGDRLTQIPDSRATPGCIACLRHSVEAVEVTSEGVHRETKLPVGNLPVNPQDIYRRVTTDDTDATMESKFEARRQNLRRLIKDRFDGLQRAMAEAIGRQPDYISRCLSGKKRIGEDLAADIERILGLQPHSLDRMPGEAPAAGVPVGRSEVPIVGKTQGGTGGYWEELGYPVGYGAEVIDAVSNDQNAYALIVEGNSMAPRMREGEAILVEPNRECHPGDEVVVRLVDGEVAVKSFVSRRDGRITLDSLSPDFERRVVRVEDIVFMHFVAGVFRAGAIREATIRTDDYEGPERRQTPMSSQEFTNVHHMPERREETPWVYEGRYKTREQRERERKAKGASRGKKGAK